MIDFNSYPLTRKEVGAILFGGCLAVALLIALGVALLTYVPGPVIEMLP